MDKRSNSTNSARIPLDDMDGICYLVNCQGRVIDCNLTFEKYFGIEKNIVIGKCFKELEIYSGESIDKNNLSIIDNSEKCYFVILEIIKRKNIYAQAKNHKTTLIRTKKRVIKNSLGDCLGILSVSEEVGSEQSVNSVSPRLGYQIREILNALIAFNQQLNSLKISEEKQDKLISNSLEDIENVISQFSSLSDRLTLKTSLTNDEGNSNLSSFFTSFLYKGLLVSNNSQLISNGFFYNSKHFCFDVVTLDNLSTNNQLRNDVSNGYYHVIIIEDTAIIDNKIKLDNLNQLTIQFVLRKVSSNLEYKVQIQELDLETSFDFEQSSVEKLDRSFFNIWRSFIKNKIQNRVKNLRLFNILSVEDDKHSQKGIKQLLEFYPDTKIDLASNASQAIEMVMKKSYDLILLDIGLPDLSGYELASRIRVVQHHTRSFPCFIYANSGHDILNSHKWIQAGIDQIYNKPHLVRNLHGILKDYLAVTHV